MQHLWLWLAAGYLLAINLITLIVWWNFVAGEVLVAIKGLFP